VILDNHRLCELQGLEESDNHALAKVRFNVQVTEEVLECFT
jgi:hypothetical protein